MSAVIVAGALVKAALFGGENIQQLLHAARQNMPHHRFLVLMGINMSQWCSPSPSTSTCCSG